MERRIVQMAASTMLTTGVVGLAGLGLAVGIAQAQPGPVPADDGHWCAPFVPCDWWQQGNWGWPWWQGGQWGQGNQGDNQQ
jgi:hypothetical protein